MTSLVEKPVPTDDVLAARVRTRVGRLVSHPGAIDVTATSGRVTLSGPVFEAEVEQLVNGVREIAGVAAIDNHLEPHAEAGVQPGQDHEDSARRRGVGSLDANDAAPGRTAGHLDGVRIAPSDGAWHRRRPRRIQAARKSLEQEVVAA
jgi:hypothetical protein